MGEDMEEEKQLEGTRTGGQEGRNTKCKGANRSGAPVQRCKSGRQRSMGDRKPERQSSKGAAWGDRMISWGHKVRGLEGPRELAPGFRRLKAEQLEPERLTTVAVTRHLE